VRGSADEPTHALLTPKVTGLRSLPNSDLFDANRSNRDPGGGGDELACRSICDECSPCRGVTCTPREWGRCASFKGHSLSVADPTSQPTMR
jgi:hypothetical protein